MKNLLFRCVLYQFFFLLRDVRGKKGGDMRYLLEFGRAVDLTTFDSAFTAAKGYFRQMLTLRTLVADSFWQGFSAGAGEFFSIFVVEPFLACEAIVVPIFLGTCLNIVQ